LRHDPAADKERKAAEPMTGKRVLILADSMAMPRADVRYEDTWIHLAKAAFPAYDFVDRSSRGATSMRLVTEGGGGVDCLELYSPDLVVMQMGLAEAAPRLIDKASLEYWLLNHVVPARYRMAYVNHVKKRRGRNPRITEVSPEQYRANLTNFFERARRCGTRVVVMLIAPITQQFIRKSPHILTNVALYNGICQEAAGPFENVTLLAPFDDGMDIEAIALDELHVNAEGHRLLFERLRPLLV
jgi:lysophospholipase L1-like esterase